MQWLSIGLAEAQLVAEIANTTPWLGTEPGRYGCVECRAQTAPEVTIVGYFKQEFQREQVSLTPDKGQQQRLEEHAEGYLFVILPNRGLISLQAKRVSGLPPRKSLEERFSELIRIIFARAQLHFARIQRKEEGPSREQYIEAFYSPDTVRVTLMEARDFSRPLPEGFPFFNPNFERNRYFQLANEDDRRQFDQVRLVASRTGDLKHSPTARGLISSSSDPRKLQIVTTMGKRTLRTREERMVMVDVDEADLSQLSEAKVQLLARATSDLHYSSDPSVQRSARKKARSKVAATAVQAPLFPGED